MIKRIISIQHLLIWSRCPHYHPIINDISVRIIDCSGWLSAVTEPHWQQQELLAIENWASGKNHHVICSRDYPIHQIGRSETWKLEERVAGRQIRGTLKALRKYVRVFAPARWKGRGLGCCTRAWMDIQWWVRAASPFSRWSTSGFN